MVRRGGDTHPRGWVGRNRRSGQWVEQHWSGSESITGAEGPSSVRSILKRLLVSGALVTRL